MYSKEDQCIITIRDLEEYEDDARFFHERSNDLCLSLLFLVTHVRSASSRYVILKECKASTIKPSTPFFPPQVPSQSIFSSNFCFSAILVASAFLSSRNRVKTQNQRQTSVKAAAKTRSFRTKRPRLLSTVKPPTVVTPRPKTPSSLNRYA